LNSGQPNEARMVMASNPTHLRGPLYAASRNRLNWYVIEIRAGPDNPKRAMNPCNESRRAS
jgi:hypothetical protein